MRLVSPGHSNRKPLWFAQAPAPIKSGGPRCAGVTGFRHSGRKLGDFQFSGQLWANYQRWDQRTADSMAVRRWLGPRRKNIILYKYKLGYRSEKDAVKELKCAVGGPAPFHSPSSFGRAICHTPPQALLRKRPWKASTKESVRGVPGQAKSISTQFRQTHCCSRFDTNSTNQNASY